jgi:hypothetical protein
LVPIPDYQKFNLGSYIEYGLTDRVTLIAQPSLDDVHQGSVQPAAPVAAGTNLGARIGLVSFGSTILSLQAVGHIPFAESSTQTGLFDQDRVPAADLGLLLGHGFTISGMTGFVDFAVSHTWQGDALPDEWHADATIGLRPIPSLLLMLAGDVTVAGAVGASCTYWTNCWSWLKLRSSAVYDLSRNWSVEAGFFATVIGQNAGRELGPLVALWYRF